MRAIGESADQSLAYDVGRVLGREVRAAGFDVDFAPVLDIDSNPLNPVIGNRSFGRDANLVGRLGVALARGLERENVASCGKHFPGHGDTMQDSHTTLPVVWHTMNQLCSRELVPFKEYAQENLASIMTAHVVIEAVEPGLPATFSRKWITDWLRNQVGFLGLVISDDLEMKAIANHYSAEEAAVRAVLAGVDWLLICHRGERQQEAIDGLAREARSSAVFRRYLLASCENISRLLRKFYQPPHEWGQAQASLQDPEHLARVSRVLQVKEAGEGTPDPTFVALGSP
jgi:beta-N-acetylhexosaminidase